MCEECVSRVCAVLDNACGPPAAACLEDAFQSGELGADDPLRGTYDMLESLPVFYGAARLICFDAVREH